MDQHRRKRETRNQRQRTPPWQPFVICVLVVVFAASAVFGFQRRTRRKQGHPVKTGRTADMKTVRAADMKTGRAVDIVKGTFMGDPVGGISAQEFELFRLGLEDFLEVEDAAEGLGPVYNGRSCAQCHSIPAIGGSGTVLETRAGILHENGTFEEFPGGSNFQMFSLPVHSIQAAIPPEANVVAHRKALPLFGLGLVEAVVDVTLLSLADPDDTDGDGVSGRVPLILDRESGQLQLGRFGWKSQQSSLFTFGAEAYRDEMGITNDLFLLEACPWGVDCELLELIDPAPDPEDGPELSTGLRGVDNFANFLRLLGPPTRGEINEEVLRGEQIFRSIGCQSCHVEALETGPALFQALSFKRFHPYGDFLLHDVGTGDGIGQAGAKPNEIRTVPLWGLRFRSPFLHDGRASTLTEAILLHKVEAENSRGAFESLSEEQTWDLLAFLKSL